MKHTEFILKLVSRYPKLEDSRYQLQDIKDNLANVGESTLDQLWNAFNSNYDRDTSPRWASINTAAQKAGLVLSSAATVKFWVSRCDYCGSYFGGHTKKSDEPQKCTGCKKIKPSTLVILDRDENPFNLNQKRFGAIAGNTNRVQPVEPHILSLDYPQWLRDHPKATEAKPVQQEQVIF